MASNINHVMLFRMAYTLFVSILVSLLFILFILFYPFDPITFGKIELEEMHAHPGGTITYKANFVKHTNKVGTIQRFLVCRNQATQTIEPQSLADATSEDTSKRRKAPIPANTIPDICRIKAVVTYPYFGVREIKTGFETPEFSVKPED